MVWIVGGDAGVLDDFAFVSVGLCNLECDAPDLAGGDDLVILAGRAPARRANSLDLQIALAFVLDFEAVDERRPRLHRTERMLEGWDRQRRLAGVLRRSTKHEY